MKTAVYGISNGTKAPGDTGDLPWLLTNFETLIVLNPMQGGFVKDVLVYRVS